MGIDHDHPEVVLIHGWGIGSDVWYEVRDVLARDYHVHCIDLPGYGNHQSGYIKTEDLTSLATYCVQRIQKPAIWIGWSLGAMVCIKIAQLYPGYVNKIVQVAGTPCFVQAKNWHYATPRIVFDQFSESLLQHFDDTLQRFIQLQVHGVTHQRKALAKLKALLLTVKQPAQQALIDGLNILKYDDLRNDLQDIKAPVLWLLGENDILIPVKVRHDISSIIPQSVIKVIPGAGHAPFISHAGAFNHALKPFLKN